MKRVANIFLASLLAACAAEPSVPLPDDPYERSLLCITVFSNTSNDLIKRGEIRESLRLVAATANAEKRRDTLAAESGRAADDIKADLKRIFDNLQQQSEVDERLLSGFIESCLAEYSARSG